jgi:hypothetical protein
MRGLDPRIHHPGARMDCRGKPGNDRGRSGQRQFSGSSLTIEPPWLLPTQNVTGVVELST